MPRIRHCRARDLNHGDRFARTVAEEVRHGLHWPDYRHALSECLLQPPDAGVPEGYRSDTLPEQYQHVESGNDYVLLGEGAYEGLTAYLTDGPGGIWGILVEGTSPSSEGR